ncbi:hypothetical protein DBP19_36030 [Streptomyces sp. CS090A]|uniref:hypothetical protein n=1 Tax=Streptomyces sp. CS090A TaxID=2162710 RepID=UPI000D5187FE|nr:hypothetical protein [Streptomyces sp. CS090A]PVC80548.1 hypothetical protein DBP19_36030 [Streptomyces sp. CS090A]
MTDTPMNPDRDPSRREELLFMLLHGGARSETIAQRVVDLALAEARAEEKAEVDRLRKRAETAASRLAAVERLAEEADDKNNHTVDTDLLLDALGLSADAPSGARLTGLPLGLTGRARHDARVAMETTRRAPKESPADEGAPEPDMPVLAGKDWGGPLARCSWGRHLAALLPTGHIGTHRMGKGWLNRCPGVGKPPRAEEETAS